MRKLTPVGLFCGAVLLSTAALAQTSPPSPSPPPAAKPDAAPVQQTTPAPEQKPTPAPSKTVTATAQTLVGKNAFSSDGTRIGDVRAVRTAPDGKIAALHIHTGGFLGFGGRIIEVPEGRFTFSGQDVRLNLTADEASKMPAVRDGT